MWKFSYIQDGDNFDIVEPLEAGTYETVYTEESAIYRVEELNNKLVDYLVDMSTREGWKDYFVD